MGSGASVGARILSSDHDYIGEVDWSYLDLPGIYVEHNLVSSSYLWRPPSGMGVRGILERIRSYGEDDDDVDDDVDNNHYAHSDDSVGK